MGIFDRWRRTHAHSGPGEEPPPRGACRCPEHAEELLGLVVPYSREMAAELDDPMTVGELVECGALDVRPTEADERHVGQDGPFQWSLWVGDEARAHYDDEAATQLDTALMERPGVGQVVWEDRELFWVASDGLCESGMLAAAARALLDPRVRLV